MSCIFSLEENRARFIFRVRLSPLKYSGWAYIGENLGSIEAFGTQFKNLGKVSLSTGDVLRVSFFKLFFRVDE